MSSLITPPQLYSTACLLDLTLGLSASALAPPPIPEASTSIREEGDIKAKIGLIVELRYIPKNSIAAAKLYFTGSGDFNKNMRII